MELLPLASDEIHLWLAFYEEVADETLHAKYRAVMTEAERAQETRFYFARDRRRYLVTRALVRTLLSRYVPIHPRDWEFTLNAYGRPEIANAAAREAQLTFNISHTHSLIVVGVTRGRAIGVDVENVVDREAAIGVANRFFAPAEVAALNVTPAAEQPYRFFEYWTFKESYIKARGMGLSLPLDRFSFSFRDAQSVELATEPGLDDDPRRWRFRQYRPSPEYLVAVCVESNADAPLRITARRSVPMATEELCTLDALRSSEEREMRDGHRMRCG